MAFGPNLEKAIDMLGGLGFSDIISKLRRMINTYLEPDGSTRNTEEFRKSINRFVVDVIHEITNADFVFVRRLNSDKSASLADHEWYTERVGRPPRIKKKNAGISTFYLNRGERLPKVIGDISQAPIDIQKAHAETVRIAETDENDVYRFVTWIQSEVYVPLMAEGKIFGAIIGTSGRTLDENVVVDFEELLRPWQQILSFLYVAGLEIDHDTRLVTFINDLHKLTLKTATSFTDDEFLRKMVTILTCHLGLEWHRALVFAFDGRYPSSAICVTAVGGNGHSKWSETQAHLTYMYGSIESYLDSCQNNEWVTADPLTNYVYDAPNVILPKGILESVSSLHQLFKSEVIDSMSDNDEGVIWLGETEDWLWSQAWSDNVFPNSVRRANRCLVPLVNVRNGICETIGFVILDNPYPHFVETKYTPGLARLVCDSCAPYLAERGFGKKEWILHLFALRKTTRNLWGSTDDSFDTLDPKLKAAIRIRVPTKDEARIKKL